MTQYYEGTHHAYPYSTLPESDIIPCPNCHCPVEEHFTPNEDIDPYINVNAGMGKLNHCGQCGECYAGLDNE